jgi:multiple sugar transport system permease protein
LQGKKERLREKEETRMARVQDKNDVTVSQRLFWTKILIYILFLMIVLLFVGPVLWMISLSLKTRAEIFGYPPRLIPRPFAFDNYSVVLTTSRIPLYLVNSFKITFFTVLGNLLVTVPAAFAFSRFRFSARREILFAILLFQMISHLILAIPLYRYFINLNMLNSHAGLILIYITVQIPFTVWLLKGFLDSIPIELDEAAIIDGCKEPQILLKVLLPLAMPGIAASLVFNTINAWGQFIIPYIFLNQDALFPISVGILHFVERQTEGEVTTHFMAVASVLALLPAIAIIITLQKFIVQVLTAGSVKG